MSKSLDPNVDPRQFGRPNPDPHQTVKPDLNPHQTEKFQKPDPDLDGDLPRRLNPVDVKAHRGAMEAHSFYQCTNFKLGAGFIYAFCLAKH